MRRRVLLAAWMGVLAGVLVGAVRLGDGTMAGPPLAPSAWSGWLTARSEAAAVMAVLRLVVVGLAGYLLLVTAVAVVTGLSLPAPAFVRGLVGAAVVSAFVAAPASASTVPPELRLLDPPTAAPVPPPAPAPPPPTTWVVQPGDHLWSIAERSAPDDVVRYWVGLVEANRDRLPDPDLVLPGQELALPDYGPRP